MIMTALIGTNSTCSPERSEHFLFHGSCLTLTELQVLVRMYNKYHPKTKIAMPAQKANNMGYLHTQLKNKLANACNPKKKGAASEICWINQPFVDSAFRQRMSGIAFRPQKPLEWYKNEYQWLNTLNILNVMHQYERYCQDFKFLGVFPIDFATRDSSGSCISREMCSFSVRELMDEGKFRFAAVFNIDRHDQPGSHWVTCFGHLKPGHPKYGIAYFDSGGSKPSSQIKDFMRNVKQQVEGVQGSSNIHNFRTKYNPTRKQFQSSECGIFCLCYIIMCLQHNDATYHKVRSMIGRDQDVHKFRDILYAPHPKVVVQP